MNNKTYNDEQKYINEMFSNNEGLRKRNNLKHGKKHDTDRKKNIFSNDDYYLFSSHTDFNC